MKKDNKKHLKTVSVVIPFKGEKAINQLEQSIKSLLNQTVLPIEIILVGSRNDFINNPKLVPFLKNQLVKLMDFVGDKNEARNTGILAAGSDYIVYLDHDMVAENDLIEMCLIASEGAEAIIIPEKSKGGSFWQNCKKLERELITYDLYTVTPRFYKKNLFKNNEKPFDSRFGLLDEWGFNHYLMNKKITPVYCKSSVVIIEERFSLFEEIKNKYKRGLWMKNFYNMDKDEAWKRINPIKRGLLFYGKRSKYLLTNPLCFGGLILLKLIDFMAFMSGYMVGYLINFTEPKFTKSEIVKIYDLLGSDYLSSMYSNNYWTMLVDKKEKDTVSSLWKFNKSDRLRDEKILDLGTGPGRWSKYFLEKGFGQVFGVDISSKMVQAASNMNSKLHFKAILADMSNLPLKSNYFDRVFCFRAFKYSSEPDKVIKEIYRVLKPQGSLLLEVSNRSFTNITLQFIASLVLKIRPGLPPESRWRYFSKTIFYTKEEIIKICSNHNLSMAIQKPLFVLPSVPLPSINKNIALIWFYIDNILFKVLLKKWFARSWVFLVYKDDV